MSVIIATRWVRNPCERCLEAGETRRFGTRKAAEMWAASALPPVVTTNDCYWRDVGRAESVECTKRYRGKRPSNKGRFWRNSYMSLPTINAAIHIVPSVGELGWTP